MTLFCYEAPEMSCGPPIMTEFSFFFFFFFIAPLSFDPPVKKNGHLKITLLFINLY